MQASALEATNKLSIENGPTAADIWEITSAEMGFRESVLAGNPLLRHGPTEWGFVVVLAGKLHFILC